MQGIVKHMKGADGHLKMTKTSLARVLICQTQSLEYWEREREVRACGCPLAYLVLSFRRDDERTPEILRNEVGT